MQPSSELVKHLSIDKVSWTPFFDNDFFYLSFGVAECRICKSRPHVLTLIDLSDFFVCMYHLLIILFYLIDVIFNYYLSFLIQF